jgi:hypothetical protein
MTTMTFLGAVNRMLTINGFIRGDTDTLSAFTDTNHASTSSIAQIAVQNEITELSSKGLLPYQHKTTGSISLVNGTRTYDLASDFVQLWGQDPFFYDATSNYQIRAYPGGEDELRASIYTYRTQSGYPISFYFELGTGQQVSFFPVPGSGENGRALTYDYSASVNVSASSDTIPFATADQQYAFVEMASRRFKYLFEGKTSVAMDTDPVYREARARLFALLKWKQQPRSYGRSYG